MSQLSLKLKNKFDESILDELILIDSSKLDLRTLLKNEELYVKLSYGACSKYNMMKVSSENEYLKNGELLSDNEIKQMFVGINLYVRIQLISDLEPHSNYTCNKSVINKYKNDVK